MEYRKIAGESGLATYALIFVTGDDAAEELAIATIRLAESGR